MFEYIQNYNLRFNGPLIPRKMTVRILLHHTSGGASETVPGIHAYHLSCGHKGIDYNICVEKNGTVVWGRGLEYCGGSVNNSNAPTKGMNSDSIAIVALGDYEVDQMPEVQKEAMKRVTRDVVRFYGITDIKGHYEVAGRGYTDCPGKYFPLDEIRAFALGQDIAAAQSDPVPVPTLQSSFALKRILKYDKSNAFLMKGKDVKAVQDHLIALGFHCGNGGPDGAFGNDTRTAVVNFQKSHRLYSDGIVGKNTCEALGGTWLSEVRYNFTLTKLLKLTSPIIKNSEEVRMVQGALRNLGYDLGKNGVDGAYGKDTRNAVVQFQEDHGLSLKDGIVGEKTCIALGGRWEC